MAKNFGKAGSVKTIREVARVSAEKAQVIVVKMINNRNLHDYPNNHEDITDTADLENSIAELGFTDPIEVTSFGQNDGEYMIVSGHRRRSAGIKCGMEIFPCIVKNFSNQNEVENYVLLSNNQRDSAKDPLLFCKRYKMHEEYLKMTNFQGKIRDEVAKRLGISTPQADRYNTMNKIILPVWDMVRDGIVGMSSVLPMASHSEDEQNDIYNIMIEALDMNITLTRDMVKKIVDSYRSGKKTWNEIREISSILPDIREEEQKIKENALMSKELKTNENNSTENIEAKCKKAQFTNEEKHEKKARDIMKNLEKLNNSLSDIYTFKSVDEAEEALNNMTSTFAVLIDEMYAISKEYNLDKVFNLSIAELKAKVKEY